MADPTDFTPTEPFFTAVARLQQEVADGTKNTQMAAGQLVAYGYPIAYEQALTMITTPVVRSASVAKDVAGRWIEQDLFAMAAGLSLELQQTVRPVEFATVATDCASDFESGALDVQRAATVLVREFNVPADVAIETIVDLVEMYRSQVFSAHGMRTICNTLQRSGPKPSPGLTGP